MSEEENIVDQAFEEIKEDALNDTIESIKQIEEQINAKHGDPDIKGQIWALISTADRYRTDGFEEDKLSAILTAEGEDLYYGLAQEELALVHGLAIGKIGTMIRTGAWMSPTGGERPSEHPEKQSCIITAAYLSNHMFFVVRFEDGTIETSYMTEEDYNEAELGSQQRLVDAILDFDYLPTALREHEPERYIELTNKIEAAILAEEMIIKEDKTD